MNIKNFMGMAVKFIFDVILPIVDIGSDVYFTVDVYNKGEIKYFITSGIFFKDKKIKYYIILLLI